MPGEGRGDVDLGLLVLGTEVRHLLDVAELLERLAETGHIAVPEDAPDTGDEALLMAVPLDVLLGHEADDGLTHGQSDSVHRTSLRNRLQRRYHRGSLHVNIRSGGSQP